MELQVNNTLWGRQTQGAIDLAIILENKDKVIPSDHSTAGDIVFLWG